MLTLYLLRSTNRMAIVVGAVVALAFGWVPVTTGIGLELSDAVTMLRFAAIGLAIGLAFVLDDPAAVTIATLPTPRHVLAALRVAPAVVLATAVWTLAWVGCRFALDAEAGPLLPYGGLLLELLALLAVTFWLAGTRWGNETVRGGVLAAPALVLLLIAAALLPDSAAVFPPPGTDRWDGSRWVWAAVLAAGLAGLARTGREPAPRSRPARSSSTPSRERINS